LALPATDSALSGLALSHGTLDPAFDPATTGYAVSVPYDVTGVRVTPTVSDPGRATVTVNGVTAESGSATGEIPLAVGDNIIQVIFTAEDHTTTTYTITVTRNGAPVISVQPTDKTVTEGQKATFTVVASGIEPLSYQWYVDREGAKGWVKIDSASARTATYTTSATKLRDSGCRYACLVENGAGSIRTDAVTLTVIEKSAPQTGDDSHLPLWIALALLSGLGLAALLATGRRGLNRR
jgi:LPXTG-motif cell wall-anchored protein